MNQTIPQRAGVSRSRSALPRHGWLGLLLIAVFWALNWYLTGLRTAYLFFPLWLGYILFVDALVLRRAGTSFLNRSKLDFVLHFAASAPAWWLFEWINRRTGNWEYVGAEQFGPVAYAVLCTVAFSTVMPAVFETTELVGTFRWMKHCANGPSLNRSRALPIAMFVIGLAMLALTLIWPDRFYALVWVSLVFILEPLNIWLGRHHLFEDLERGDWRLVVSLALGALICGFFWEMWNFYSYPKWIYHTPGVEIFHIFEMPLLGYGGYLFFALELHAIRSLLWPGAPKLTL